MIDGRTHCGCVSYKSPSYIISKVIFVCFQLRKKQNIVEQAGQLKRFVVSLQLAADKREQSERNLRYKLEKEVEALRLGSKQVRSGVVYSLYPFTNGGMLKQLFHCYICMF